MNFFEHQAQARVRTRQLLLLFVLGVLLVVAAVDAVVLLTFGYLALEAGTGQLSGATGPVLLWSSGVTLALILLASLYKSLQLRRGGAAVARELGAVPVPVTTEDLRLRRLRNVVEEMAIASGMPAPALYWLPDEGGINAFAAGFSTADAVVAVTRGCLDKLSRDELQGVVAHEFSHVRNGDMRLNLRLMGAIFGLLAIHLVGREILDGMRHSRASRKNGGGILIFALALMLIGWLGTVFGRLIQAAVSRSRELLADASAVQFTRQTSGLAGALQKIAGLQAGSRMEQARAREVAHMLFGDGFGATRLFATHPPLLLRIRRLQPGFQLQDLQQRARDWNRPDYVPPDTGVASLVGAGMGEAGSAVLPSSDDVRHAQAIHAALPPRLLTAAHDPREAEAVVLALLLDRQPALRVRQLQRLAGQGGTELCAAVEALAPEVENLHPALRLPLVTIAFPLLAAGSRAAGLDLLRRVSLLVHADGQQGVFEFCLAHLLRTLIADSRHPARTRTSGRRRLPECAAALEQLLSLMAQQGAADPAAASRAFAAGAAGLGQELQLRYCPPPCDLGALDRALRDLDQLRPAAKDLLVEALLRTVEHDRRVAVGEAELLRVVCAALHYPMPPLALPAPAALHRAA